MTLIDETKIREVYALSCGGGKLARIADTLIWCAIALNNGLKEAALRAYATLPSPASGNGPTIVNWQVEGLVWPDSMKSLRAELRAVLFKDEDWFEKKDVSPT